MTEAEKIAFALRSDGPHYVLGAAFRCAFMMRPPERLFPCHFLALRDNGLVEPFDNKRGEVLTPLGLEVREILRRPGLTKTMEARRG